MTPINYPILTDLLIDVLESEGHLDAAAVVQRQDTTQLEGIEPELVAYVLLEQLWLGHSPDEAFALLPDALSSWERLDAPKHAQAIKLYFGTLTPLPGQPPLEL